MLTSIPFARPQDCGPSVAIVTKVNRIQDQLVKKHDVELHMHLNRLEIAPQIYGMSVFTAWVQHVWYLLWPSVVHKCSYPASLCLSVCPAAGGYVSCSAASFHSRTCWWSGTLCLLTASLWTWLTISLWPCCSTSETLVRSIYYWNNPIRPCVVFVACNFIRNT